ncbi:hypothetical protein CO083_04860 [Candidatus Roizmanbacteria bacterium CG_4_9_14_0_8_um_filter_34_12]|uniref:Prepilin peptidase n=6 Tax=Candidatus Roizmaniibacteriota TaxID=1752723 RepID=A0A2M8DBR6_9BACT|nr:MAG: hypothetical protein CO083_04860 [Candidatus Roizmanbacteria bacterium CG_4_9_14_0_8_um_filter_34_12]
MFNEYYFLIPFIFILGAAIGSFLNVLIDRWLNDQPITGRSCCDHCKKQLKSLDLIPIFSFLFLSGRSRCCNKKLSWQYPLVEMVTGVLFVLVVIASPALRDVAISLPIGQSILTGLLPFDYATSSVVSLRVNLLAMILMLATVSCLIVIFFADVKYQIIPDQIQILLFLFSIFYFLFSSNWSIQSLIIRLLSGVVVMLPILLIYLISRGRGMGFGDVKLAFNMGILLGIKGGLLALYFAFIIGGIFGAYLLLSKKKKLKSKIAFGPFLVLGTIILLFFNPIIIFWLKQTYGF